MIRLDEPRERLEAALPIAREGRDPEGVHALRTATRRLSVWLWLAGRPSLRDDLRWLRSRASTVRDLDVLLASEPPRAFAAFLSGERRKARRALVAALDAERTKGLLEALGTVPPLALRTARARREELLERVRRRGRAFREDPSELDKLHDLRRAVRTLRYAYELCGDDAGALAKVQDVFGAVGDLALSRTWLAAKGAPGLATHRRGVDAKLHAARREAARLWPEVERALGDTR